MIYSYKIRGIPVQTGDIICTTDGSAVSGIMGRIWMLMGMLLVGEVDHIVIYIGPGGRCVESGPWGVRTFIVSRSWNPMPLVRGIIDTVYGVAYPLYGIETEGVREAVASYCLAQVGKPYNFNFFNSTTTKRFYCSQLGQVAYLKHGINLDPKGRIILPQRIYDGCYHRRVECQTTEKN